MLETNTEIPPAATEGWYVAASGLSDAASAL